MTMRLLQQVLTGSPHTLNLASKVNIVEGCNMLCDKVCDFGKVVEVLGTNFERSFSIRHKFDLAFAFLSSNFHCSKWPCIERIY